MTEGWLLTRMVAVSRAGLEGSCLISEAQPPLLAGTRSAFSSGKEGWCPPAGGSGGLGRGPGMSGGSGGGVHSRGRCWAESPPFRGRPHRSPCPV